MDGYFPTRSCTSGWRMVMVRAGRQVDAVVVVDKYGCKSTRMDCTSSILYNLIQLYDDLKMNIVQTRSIPRLMGRTFIKGSFALLWKVISL